MGKLRVTGRFYVFLTLVTVIILFIFRDSLFGSGAMARVVEATASDIRSVDAVIVRDEELLSSKQVSRLEYLADEGTLVAAGDPVAYVYSLEYSEKLIRELNTVRKNIQSYHNILLGNEIDASLEVYDLTVKQKALDLKNLIAKNTSGNFISLVTQLEEAMAERRAYMSATMRSDTKLIKYYDEEKQKISAIDAWRNALVARDEGVVSFYLDGYENDLTIDNIGELTIDKMRKVLSGELLSQPSARDEVNVAKIINQNHWYLVVMSEDGSWNPVNGQNYSFQMIGFEDLLYTGVVRNVQKMGATVMAQIEITDPIGPLMYQRTGKAAIGANLTGLSVPAKAIIKQNGQTGVLLYDVPGGTFIPVEVLSEDKDNALIMPLVEGVLTSNSWVLVQ
ncbi:MAG: hypothetical protein IJN21_07350 [Clostridia bacterium]|nr:hypothetical protein [Clostridia bacterium]